MCGLATLLEIPASLDRHRDTCSVTSCVQASLCVHTTVMRITHVPYTKRRVTTLDLVRPDEILYRDEENLAGTKDNLKGLNTR